MQPLTIAPRDNLTADQVRALITGPDLSVDYGVELLDASLALVEDISGDVSACTVSHDNTAEVHGSVSLSIARELAWGRDRVRPYTLLSSGSQQISARFNLGAYLLTTPDTTLGESPTTYKVSGFDQLHLLQAYIGDAYYVAAGANVLDAVRAALTAAGVTAPVLLDSTASAAVFPAGGKTWPLIPSSSSADPTLAQGGSGGFRWIDVVNDLLKAVGYGGIWCDWDGAFRAGPFVDPAQRAVEWVFPVGDLRVGIVEPDRTVAADVWGVPNRQVFYQNGLTGVPVEGVSQYTANNIDRGLSSQYSLGRVVNAQPQGLDAVNFAALKTQGDKIMNDALRVTETITTKLGPVPIAWHEDVATYSDPDLGADRRVRGVTWSLCLDSPNTTPMAYAWETVQ